MVSGAPGVQSVQSLEKYFKSFAHERCGCSFNSSPPSVPYVHQWTGNNLSPVQCQAIIWTNADLLLIEFLEQTSVKFKSN